MLSQSLPTCETFSLIVKPKTNSTVIGTPPYYLMAFEVGGIPTTNFAGTDPNSLNWQVNHQAGEPCYRQLGVLFSSETCLSMKELV